MLLILLRYTGTQYLHFRVNSEIGHCLHCHLSLDGLEKKIEFYLNETFKAFLILSIIQNSA